MTEDPPHALSVWCDRFRCELGDGVTIEAAPPPPPHNEIDVVEGEAVVVLLFILDVLREMMVGFDNNSPSTA